MKFRKKPVVIEARQYDGENADEIISWMEGSEIPGTRGEAIDGFVIISTLEGDMKADPNDWIIRGVKGEFYPCKPDIFQATYEAVK